MTSQTIGSMEHIGDSSNIAYYAERNRKPGYVWAEVLRHDFDFKAPRRPDGTIQMRKRPLFYIEVHRGRRSATVAKFDYEPQRQPKPGPLPARTMTTLVRQALGAKGATT